MTDEYICYMGNMVSTNHFRVFVYDKDGNQKLCNNHMEYVVAKDNGWLDEKPTQNEQPNNEPQAKAKEPKPKRRGKRGKKDAQLEA